MLVGNLAALVQTNVKRMLAYSSIAHAGYILVAFAASTSLGVAAVLFYLAAYVFMKVGAFLIVTHLGQQDEKRVSIQDYSGLASKQPVVAACFSLFLLSLLGLPATGGFLGKFFAFQSALDRSATIAHSARRHRRHQQRHRRLLLLARDHHHVFPGAVQGLHAVARRARRRHRPGHRRCRHALPGHPSRLASSTSLRPPPIPCSRTDRSLPRSVNGALDVAFARLPPILAFTGMRNLHNRQRTST